MKPHHYDLPPVSAGAVAGMAAAVAYAIEQEVDLRVFDHNADDLILLGGLITRKRAAIRPIGLAIHLVNGAAAGMGYALLVHERLPGPPIVRGISFALTQTAALYPLALFEDHHPAIRRGELGRYWNRTAFAQSLLRHLIFGAVLGHMTARLQRP